jgi:hypothetical protein
MLSPGAGNPKTGCLGDDCGLGEWEEKKTELRNGIDRCVGSSEFQCTFLGIFSALQAARPPRTGQARLAGRRPRSQGVSCSCVWRPITHWTPPKSHLVASSPLLSPPLKGTFQVPRGLQLWCDTLTADTLLNTRSKPDQASGTVSRSVRFGGLFECRFFD